MWRMIYKIFLIVAKGTYFLPDFKQLLPPMITRNTSAVTSA